MTTNTKQKAAGATNTNGLHTDTNSANFPTAEQKSKAIANQIAVLALAKHHVFKGDMGDFTVCKYGMTRYCADFAELQAFARKLGVNHE